MTTGRWVGGLSGKWSVGRWSVVLIKPVFQKILVESNRKPNTLWVDKSSEFNNRSMKSLCLFTENINNTLEKVNFFIRFAY